MERPELSDTELKIYLHLLNRREPAGPRDIAKELKMPVSTVHYNLRKLEKKGLVERSLWGYTVKGKTKIEGFVSIGARLFPRFILYSFFFLGISVGTISLIILRGPTPERLLLLLVSFAAFSLMFAEGYLLRKRLRSL